MRAAACACCFSRMKSLLELLNMASTQCTASLCSLWKVQSNWWRELLQHGFYSLLPQLWHCLIFTRLNGRNTPKQSWGRWGQPPLPLSALSVLLSLKFFCSNCWIHRPSMAPFSMSCYTTAVMLPPILLKGDCRDCGAALLPWQQALSQFPHITRTVGHHLTGGLRGSVRAVYI